jgi:hypothetical protein
MDARPARPFPRRERSRLAVLAAIAHPRGASPSHTSKESPADSAIRLIHLLAPVRPASFERS